MNEAKGLIPRKVCPPWPGFRLWAFLLVMAAAGSSGLAVDLQLNREMGDRFARLALSCLEREYPNKMDHVMNDASEVVSPRKAHPAFYGCFDWHSCVHGHWMLVRLLRRYADLPSGPAARAALNRTLTPATIAGELAYLRQKDRKIFERPYGWAWVLKLAEELTGWDDPDGKKWNEALKPLAQEISSRLQDFLPRQTYPIRAGTHNNTAFALGFALDYARAAGDIALERIVKVHCRIYFERDTQYPFPWEPSGEDFLSPGLEEADLMRRVMEPDEYLQWMESFLTGLEATRANFMVPATVSDRTDGKLVHLDGLNLSRAWCLYGIAKAMPPTSRARAVLIRVAETHLAAGLPFVTSGNYEGEHWLATFAVYALCERENAVRTRR